MNCYYFTHPCNEYPDQETEHYSNSGAWLHFQLPSESPPSARLTTVLASNSKNWFYFHILYKHTCSIYSPLVSFVIYMRFIGGVACRYSTYVLTAVLFAIARIYLALLFVLLVGIWIVASLRYLTQSTVKTIFYLSAAEHKYTFLLGVCNLETW